MFTSPYQQGMRWFEGVVESRLDPTESGRVQVRVFGIHTDNLSLIPTEDLLWMQVMHPTTSPATSGVSETPSLVEGSHVVGYFRDGNICQDGLVIGSIAGIPIKARNPSKGFADPRQNLSSDVVPGKPENVEYNESGVLVTEATRQPYPNYLEEPDLSRLARHKNIDNTILSAKRKSQAKNNNIKIAGGGVFSEPSVPYNAKYPYNKVSESESGHVLEFDDTPKHERVHLAHRTGSFVEMHPNGDFVLKAAKDLYDMVHGNRYTHISGVETVTIDKGMSLLINSKESNQNLTIEVGSGGNFVLNISGGNVSINVDGDMTTNCSGDYTINARTINLN